MQLARWISENVPEGKWCRVQVTGKDEHGSVSLYVTVPTLDGEQEYSPQGRHWNLSVDNHGEIFEVQ
jgi:hypothetical protein